MKDTEPLSNIQSKVLIQKEIAFRKKKIRSMQKKVESLENSIEIRKKEIKDLEDELCKK